MNGSLFFVVSGMNITIHRSLEVRLPENALDCLYISASIVQHGSERMPENMGSRAMQINCFVNANHHAAERLKGYRCVWITTVDNISFGFNRIEESQQIFDDRNRSVTTFCLWGSDKGLIVSVCHTLR